MEILYGILIAALMGLSAFAGAWFAMRLKSPTRFWQIFPPDNGKDAEGVGVALPPRIKPLQYDSEPQSAEEFNAFYKRETHSEALKDATGH